LPDTMQKSSGQISTENLRDRRLFEPQGRSSPSYLSLRLFFVRCFKKNGAADAAHKRQLTVRSG